MITDMEIKTARVLVVDDQPANVLLLTRMLAAAGYSAVSGTTDARNVAGLYLELRPDLVLLDLRMPHLDGFQLMLQLQGLEQGSYVPVLVLTAQTDIQSRLRALSLGARDFLTKPFDRLEVLTRIRNLIEVRLMHNRLRASNQALEARVEERTRDLHNAQLEIIQRLGHAVEFRDNETGMHVVRMGRFSRLLGETLGLEPDECDILLHAAPMHDIGKLAIPDRILLKPGPLNPDEWSIMKTHPVIGANLLAHGRSKVLQMAESIALTHHERWDGSGYPHGLKEEAIPLEGRICALSDVFDALTSSRPYKNAWSIPDAVRVIERESGRHFDPDLVEAFKEVLPHIIDIKLKYGDEVQPSLPQKSAG